MGVPDLEKEALQTFQAIFAEIMNDPQKKAELKNGMQSEGISEVTLYRWANRTSRPRPANIVALMKHCTWQDREKLAPAVAYLVGPHVPLPMPSPVVSSIPSAFYERILTALTEESSPSRRFMTISYLVLYQALHHLDPFHMGLEIIISQLLPPTGMNGTIYCLHERVSLSLQKQTALESRWALLGAESQLEGNCVSFMSDQITSQGNTVAAPLLRVGRVSGCLSIKSTVPGYFDPTMQKLVHDYAQLVSLALEDHHFYEQECINLLVLPPPGKQKPLLETLHPRKIALMMQDHLDSRQAEDMALQQIAKEMSETSGE